MRFVTAFLCGSGSTFPPVEFTVIVFLVSLSHPSQKWLWMFILEELNTSRGMSVTAMGHWAPVDFPKTCLTAFMTF